VRTPSPIEKSACQGPSMVHRPYHACIGDGSEPLAKYGNVFARRGNRLDRETDLDRCTMTATCNQRTILLPPSGSRSFRGMRGEGEDSSSETRVRSKHRHSTLWERSRGIKDGESASKTVAVETYGLQSSKNVETRDRHAAKLPMLGTLIEDLVSASTRDNLRVCLHTLGLRLYLCQGYGKQYM